MALTVGELVAYLDLDANPFTKNLSAAMRNAEQQGGRMKKVGDDLSRNVTVPLIAGGAAAVKLGIDFDTAFSRMVGLAGVPAEEVDRLQQSVLRLAGETGRAPQELADALYDAASAGLDSAQAMDAVDIAARGAAAGMGTTGDIVGLIASATASYGAEAIDAAKATDILTATIRAGRADPNELAGTLGRILPIANQLGVSFEEVGGTVAYLSNVFGDTNRTVTAISGLLVKLVSPTQQGRKALDEMGTSVEELQGAIDRDGLMGALDLLREKGFAGNQQALRALFDDIEGFQAALALLNDESGTLTETMGEVADSGGAMGEAFDQAAGTDGFKLQQSLTKLKVAAIEAGDTIAPFVTMVATGVGTVADAFDALPGPAQNVVLVLAAVAAASGPVLSVAGRLVSGWGKVTSAMETTALKGMYLGDNLGSIASKAAGLATQIGIAYAATQLLGGEADRADMSKLENSLLDVAEAGRVSGESANVFGDDLGKLRSSIEQLASPSNATKLANVLEAPFRALGDTDDDLSQARARIDDLDTALSTLAARDPEAAAAALEAIVEGLSPEEGERLVGLLDKYDSALSQVDTAQRTTADSAGELPPELAALGDASQDVAGDMEAQAQATLEAEEALNDLVDAVFASLDSNVGYRRSVNGVEDAVAKLAEVAKDGKSTQEDLERATLDAEDAMLNQATAAVRLAEDQAAAAGSTLDAKEKARIYSEQLYLLAMNLKPGSTLHNALVNHINTVNAIPDSASTSVTADMSPAERTVQEWINRSRTARIQMQIDNPYARVPGMQVRDAGGPILGPKGSPQMVLAHAGEVVLPTHRMGLGAALQHTLGMSSAPALTGQQAAGGRHFEVHGDLVVETRDSPRQWIDEGLWRVT